jgi:two-component system, LytTR family, sensor histidine kinase AlgZ
MQTFFQRNRILVLHLSFWCVYLSFFLYQSSRWAEDWRRIAIAVVSTLPFTLLITYSNYFYFLPRFLEKKKIGQYLLEFVIPFALVVYARVQLERYLLRIYEMRSDYLYTTQFVVHVSAVTLFIVIFVAMLRFAQEWFELETRKKEVENEKLTSELNFLKAQINPHFLFNTLNNLYYLAYTQSPNTTEVISKLSQMMRYMIYDSNHPRVMLSKEIEYMENYISLEKMRLNNEIPIDFTVKGNVQGVMIVPLILITFLENAFKHGVSNNHPGAWVKLSIDIRGKECTYTVANSKLAVANTSAGEKSGIGLQNVRRRLELSYPGQYTLHVAEPADQYVVQLHLTLAEHELPHSRRRAVSA